MQDAAGEDREARTAGAEVLPRTTLLLVPLLQQAVRKLSGTGPSDPYEGYANYNLGYALYRSGNCAGAVPYFQRAIRLEPDRSEPRAFLRRAQRCS